MNILYLVYDDAGNPWLGGGGAIGTPAIACYLVEKGHRVTILTGAYPRCPRTKLDAGYRIVFAGLGPNYLLSRLCFTIFAFLHMLRFWRHYDLIVDDLSPHSPTFSFLFSKLRPVIANMRNIFGMHAFRKHPVAGIIPFVIEKLFLSCYRHYLVVSPFMIARIPRSKRCVMIPNGLNYDEIPPLDQSQERTYLAFLGRIEIYQKSLDTLADALVMLRESLFKRSLKLKAAGSGKDLVAFQELIRRKELDDLVEFVGRVERQEKFRFLSRALLLLCPSRYEAMPRVPLESQACGTPVIATRIPPFEFVIKDGETGILVAPDSATELAAATRELVADDEKRCRFSANGIEYMRKFDHRVFLQQRLDYYQEVAGAFAAARAR